MSRASKALKKIKKKEAKAQAKAQKLLNKQVIVPQFAGGDSASYLAYLKAHDKAYHNGIVPRKKTTTVDDVIAASSKKKKRIILPKKQKPFVEETQLDEKIKLTKD